MRRLPPAEKLVLARESEVQVCHGEVEQWRRLTADEKLLQTKVAAIEREAGQAALKAQELARRFGLTAEVPCAGTGLQGQCKLLSDAYEAKSLIPSASTQIVRLEEERGNLIAQLAQTQRQAAVLADASAKLDMAEERLRRAKAKTSALAPSAARRGELLQAREARAGVDRQIRELTAADSGETAEEQAERLAIAHVREQIAAQRAAESQRHRESLNRVDAALTTLPAPFDELQVMLAQQAVARMQRDFADAESAFMTAVRDQHRAEEARRRQVDIAHRIDRVDARCARIEEALGRWMLFAKCMSNDGLIALSINDAGPALSGLTNDLLLACYGPRFTVSIKTLIDTAKGEARICATKSRRRISRATASLCLTSASQGAGGGEPLGEVYVAKASETATG